MRPSFQSFAVEFMKIAEEKKKSPALDMAKIIGTGVLGFGAGTAAGLGAGWLIDKTLQGMKGRTLFKNQLMIAAPVLGTATGIAYSIQKAREQEALRRVLEDSTNASRS